MLLSSNHLLHSQERDKEDSGPLSPPSLLIPKTAIQLKHSHLNLDRPDYFSFIKGMKKGDLANPAPDSLIRLKQTKALGVDLRQGEKKLAKLTAKGIEGFLQSAHF